MAEEDRRGKFWERTSRTADVLQILGWFGIPSAAVIVFFLLTGSTDEEKTPPASGSEVTTVSTGAVAVTTPPAPPTVAPVTTSPPTPGRGPLLISFYIDETYSVGKDKAGSCPVIQVFCLVIHNEVSDNNGEVKSGCTLSWNLYREDSPTLLQKDRITACSMRGFKMFIGRTPMSAGIYRLEANVELDDGTTGSATYKFTLVD